MISEGGGALGKYLCLSSRSVSHIGRAAMDDLQSPQIKRYESEAVVGLTIRPAVRLLPQAHQSAGLVEDMIEQLVSVGLLCTI